MGLPEEVFATLSDAEKALLQRHPLYPVLVELSACLCARVDTACFCGILMGDDLPVEFAGECEGNLTAYVRLASAYPSTIAFPEPDPTLDDIGLRAWQVAVGVVRNAGWPEDPSEFSPTDAQRFALLQMGDQQAAWEAIACCFRETYDELDVSGPIWTTFPVQGNVGGGEWLLTIRQPF